MAEARLGGHAADPHDERGVAPGDVVGVGIAAVLEHEVEPVHRVDVAGMRAEDDARRDLGGEVGHAVRARVEGHERLLGRQEVLLRRSHGGRIGKLDVVGRFDGLEGVALVALDRSHHFVGFHERRHERGKFSSVDDSIEHAHVLFSSGIPRNLRCAKLRKQKARRRSSERLVRGGALGTCFTRRRCRSRARRIPGNRSHG